MHGLGKHILAEFYGCSFERLNDAELLGRASLDAVQRSGATIMSHHVQPFEPQGVSGVIVIAESHLSFHTWPEHGYAAVDYFTCGDRIDIHLAVDVMAEALQAKRSERTLHWRGAELAHAPPSPAQERMLFVDGAHLTPGPDDFVCHEMLAHVPLVLHPDPRRVLIIGVGDGGLLGQVLRHDTVERVDLVEIDEQVVPRGAAALDDARVQLHLKDGARFVEEAAPDGYDVALVNASRPSGPARVLFGAGFYRDLQRLLAPTGLLAAHSLSPWVQAEDQREMYGALGAVWSEVLAYHATVPTRAGGLCTFACCGNDTLDFGEIDRSRAAILAEHCRYYTTDLQVAAFHLPRFVRQSTVEIARAQRAERRATGENP